MWGPLWEPQARAPLNRSYHGERQKLSETGRPQVLPRWPGDLALVRPLPHARRLQALAADPGLSHTSEAAASQPKKRAAPKGGPHAFTDNAAAYLL